MEKAKAFVTYHLLMEAIEGQLSGKMWEARELWYKGLVKWDGIDTMDITVTGLSRLYQLEETC